MIKAALLLQKSITLTLLVMLLSGCSQDPSEEATELSGFVDLLKQNGVEGKLNINLPNNPEIEYVATYTISAYTSTRILTLFKFIDEQNAATNLELLMQNPKMSGQAQNGLFVMGATFYPPDEESVKKLRNIFLDHTF